MLFSTFMLNSLSLCTCILINHKKIIQPMFLCGLDSLQKCSGGLGPEGEERHPSEDTGCQTPKGTETLCCERKLMAYVNKQNIFLRVYLSIFWKLWWVFFVKSCRSCRCYYVKYRGYEAWLKAAAHPKLTDLPGCPGGRRPG